MRRRHIAVVGASLAGLRTIEALRRLGNDAEITLVGEEDSVPYDRPPLSKAILLGKAEAESLELASVADLEALAVEFRPGTRATGLDIRARRLHLGAETLGFDDLVIATGASARRPAALPDLEGIHVLRTVADGTRVRAAFEGGPRVVVLGGGFIGSEVASSARALGLEVTVVDLAPVLMERGLGPVVGARMTRIAADAGVRLHLRSSVTAVSGTDRVESVTLDDGTELAADLLVVGVGADPRTDWLTSSGLRLDDGVVCDRYLRAAPGIHAVGDVARHFHPLYGRYLRFEHWTAAGEQADALAANLTGTPTAAESVPYVWSDQFDQKIQIAGLPDPADDVRFLVDRPGKFVAIAGSGDEQRAAFALNAPGTLVRQRMNLAARPPWPPEMG